MAMRFQEFIDGVRRRGRVESEEPETVVSTLAEDAFEFSAPALSEDDPVPGADALAGPAENFPLLNAHRGGEQDFDVFNGCALSLQAPIDSRANDARIINNEHIRGIQKFRQIAEVGIGPTARFSIQQHHAR
jgi:hypothetical protein